MIRTPEIFLYQWHSETKVVLQTSGGIGMLVKGMKCIFVTVLGREKWLKLNKMLEVPFFFLWIFSRTEVQSVPYSTVQFECSENGCGLLVYTHECIVSSDIHLNIYRLGGADKCIKIPLEFFACYFTCCHLESKYYGICSLIKMLNAIFFSLNAK